jgi:hypothetical protein
MIQKESPSGELQAVIPLFMTSDELRKSWAISLRHLAASRFYLQEHLPNTDAEEAWINAQAFLHHNELELALEELQELGELCSAPRAFWSELLLAAQNMSLADNADFIQQRL